MVEQSVNLIHLLELHLEPADYKRFPGRSRHQGSVAQLVEQEPSKLCVEGSIPSLATRLNGPVTHW